MWRTIGFKSHPAVSEMILLQLPVDDFQPGDVVANLRESSLQLQRWKSMAVRLVTKSIVLQVEYGNEEGSEVEFRLNRVIPNQRFIRGVIEREHMDRKCKLLFALFLLYSILYFYVG